MPEESIVEDTTCGIKVPVSDQSMAANPHESLPRGVLVANDPMAEIGPRELSYSESVHSHEENAWSPGIPLDNTGGACSPQLGDAAALLSPAEEATRASTAIWGAPAATDPAVEEIAEDLAAALSPVDGANDGPELVAMVPTPHNKSLPGPKMTRKSIAAAEVGRARRALAAARAAASEDPFASALEKKRQLRERRTSYGHVVSALNKARKSFLAKALVGREEQPKRTVAFGRTTQVRIGTGSCMGPTRQTPHGANTLFRAHSCDTPDTVTKIRRGRPGTRLDLLNQFLRNAEMVRAPEQESTAEQDVVYEPFTFTLPRGADSIERNRTPLARSASTPAGAHYQAVTFKSPDNSSVFRSPMSDQTASDSALSPVAVPSKVLADPPAPNLAAAVEEEIDALAQLLATPAPPPTLQLPEDGGSTMGSPSDDPKSASQVAIVSLPVAPAADMTQASSVEPSIPHEVAESASPGTPDAEDRATPARIATSATTSDASDAVAAVLAEETALLADDATSFDMPTPVSETHELAAAGWIAPEPLIAHAPATVPAASPPRVEAMNHAPQSVGMAVVQTIRFGGLVGVKAATLHAHVRGAFGLALCIARSPALRRWLSLVRSHLANEGAAYSPFVARLARFVDAALLAACVVLAVAPAYALP